jgi:hypothetical protein
MNDTKYNPATSETENLMDGSPRSVKSYVAWLAKSWNLNQLQRTLAIISAVSSLFFLINVNGQIYIWLCALTGLLQLWMCVKKVKTESFSMAFTYSLLSIGSFIAAIQQIINYGGYYFSGWRGAERVIVQLVLYALVAIAWILVLKKDENKNTLRLVFFVISCVFGAYEVIYVLLALRTSFKLALYGLAWIGFIAVFAIQVFMLYRKNAPQNHTFVQSVNRSANPINPQMSYYSSEQPQTSTPPQEQPSAVSETVQTPSSARETVFCTQCGAAMDNSSMFCTKCGARLKNNLV